MKDLQPTIHDLRITLSLSDAFIAKGWEPLSGYIAIPGLYNNQQEIMLYLKPRVSVHAAEVVADGIRFMLDDVEDTCLLPLDNCPLALDVVVSEGRVEVERV